MTGARLGYDDLLSHLQCCATGIRQPIQLPRTPNHLDAVLGGQESHGVDKPERGESRKLQRIAFLPLSYKMEQVVCACHPADGEKPLDEGRIEGDKMYAKTADEKILWFSGIKLRFYQFRMWRMIVSMTG